MNWFIWTLSAFAFAVLLHALLTRIPLKGNSLLIFLSAGGVVGFSLALALLRNEGPSVTMLAGITLYAFLCELYIFSFTFVISSLSVAILLALARNHGIERMREASGDEMTQRRIQRLTLTGLITNHHGMLRPSSKGRLVSSLLRVCRRIFKHDSL